MKPRSRPLRVWLGVSNLSKASGGPAVVVQNLSQELATAGAEVTILTGALSEGESENLPENGVHVIHCPRERKLRNSLGRISYIREALTQAHALDRIDVFHDFGLWMPCNHTAASICATLKVPYINSPCGMLAPWAMKHKAWKKRIAWWLYQKRDLASACALIGTSKQEVACIQKLFPSRPVALVPNGVGLTQVTYAKTERSEGRKLVFLGRIHPVKGLLNLVKAWAELRPAGWSCIIAGPDEGGHRLELEKALTFHKVAEEFTFVGMLEGEQKWRFLADADLFVHPSYTENFGIAIAEALAMGIPVVTTKGTPWQELETSRCGWWIETGVKPLAKALSEAMSLDDNIRFQMGQRGQQLIRNNYTWPKIACEMNAIYRWAHGGAKPDVFA